MARGTEPTRGRETVLVVEDDIDLAALASELLSLEGYLVASAGNGRDALTLLDAGLAPAVIVCDLMMPVLDGFGFLAEHARRPAPRPPVLAVSAFEAYLERARAAGADAVLPKPYPLDDLVAAVAALAAGRAAPVRQRAARDESARLAEIALLALDQPGPTAALDEFAARTARIFDVPVALVSIVTAERQFWHASCGLPRDLSRARGTARDVSFCTHAVAARAALVVQDAAANPFFADNPLVRERGFRFYAGVPLLSRSGEALGTLCLLDQAPRGFGAVELELLGVLARRVVAELESRDRALRPDAPTCAFRHLDAWDAELDLLGRTTLEEVARLEALRARANAWPLAVAAVAVPDDEVATAAVVALGALPAAHLGRLGRARIGVVAPRLGAAEVRATLREACGARAIVAGIDVDRPDGGPALLGAVEALLGDTGLARSAARSATP